MIAIKKILPRTLLGRSLLILIVPVVLLQVITTYMFFDRHWNKMTRRLVSAVSGEVSSYTAFFENTDSSYEADYLAQKYANNLGIEISYEPNGILPDEIGGQIAPLWKGYMAQQLQDELETKLKNPFILHSDYGAENISIYIELQDGVLKFVLSQKRMFSSSGYIFLLWMSGSSILLLLIAIVFMRNQIRPIRKLAVAANRFGKGRDTPSFKPEGALEVRQAANAFLDMRRRIQRQISQRTDMLAGVSHDLRTPLTRMKLQIEMLPEGTDKEDLRQDISDMERMIQGYLDFVRGEGDEHHSLIELDVFAEKLAEAFRRQNVQVHLNVEQGLRLMARPIALDRALGNFLSNAAKYAKQIWFTVKRHEEYVYFVVEDDGPGVPEALYEDIFKPFVRVDTSRNSETGGVGLGLPIAQDIIHAHGGSITLGRSEYGGLRVEVRIPL